MNPAHFEASAAQLDDGIHVIAVRGELDLSTAPALEGPLDAAVSGDASSVLIDLTDCEFIDSTGIALIVRAWQQLDQGGNGGSGGSVVICSSNDQVPRVLEITGLELSIPIHGTREEALDALRG